MAKADEQLKRPSFKFLPISIRLETLGGIATPFVLRGTPLPAKRIQQFSTVSEDQNSVQVNILIGESPLVEKCTPVGRFHIREIPPAPTGKPDIKLVFEVEPTLAINVSAAVDGKVMAKTQFLPNAKLLTPESIDRLRHEAEQSRAQDEQRVNLIEARTAAERAIKKAEDLLEAFHENKAVLTDPSGVSQTIAEIGQALEADDVAKIRDATQRLESKLSQGFDFGSLFGESAFPNLFTTPPPSRIKRSSPRSPTQSSSQPKSRSAPMKQAGEVAKPSLRNPNLGRVFGGGEFTLDPNLCFVLMPFAETFRPIYEDHIRPIIQAQGLNCLRSDEIVGTTLITRDIWEKINRARFIIADLSGQNPNVFYEVGLAHALGKDVLLLTQTMTDVPFDLKPLRCIVYSYTPRGMQEMESALKATISVIMKSA